MLVTLIYNLPAFHHQNDPLARDFHLTHREVTSNMLFVIKLFEILTICIYVVDACGAPPLATDVK